MLIVIVACLPMLVRLMAIATVIVPVMIRSSTKGNGQGTRYTTVTVDTAS